MRSASRSKLSSDRSRSAALSLAGPLSLHLEDLCRRTEIGKTRRFRPIAGPQWQRLILAIDDGVAQYPQENVRFDEAVVEETARYVSRIRR